MFLWFLLKQYFQNNYFHLDLYCCVTADWLQVVQTYIKPGTSDSNSIVSITRLRKNPYFCNTIFFKLCRSLHNSVRYKFSKVQFILYNDFYDQLYVGQFCIYCNYKLLNKVGAKNFYAISTSRYFIYKHVSWLIRYVNLI